MIVFVTGTDTDSGKTLISSALLRLATGTKCGLKPIASGCELTADGLRNEDALALMAQSNMALDYNVVNPIAFAPAIAPHIAAEQMGVSLDAGTVQAHLLPQEASQADFMLIEGAGGWRLPLGHGLYLSDCVVALDKQLTAGVGLVAEKPLSAVEHSTGVGVVLVVGMKLGCLNHALLTQQAIESDGLNIVGWIANQVDANMSEIEANLTSLQQMMTAPFLGYVPYLESPSAEHAAAYLSAIKQE